MKVLIIGDVFAESGKRCVEALVPQLREQYEVDLVVVNGENAARGLGLHEKQAKSMFASGVDVITLGNHAFRQRDILPYLDSEQRIIRPANLPARSPGRGLTYVEVPDGEGGIATEVCVINLMGQLYLDVGTSPWEIIDGLVEQAAARTPVIIVDMHAEATSEKVAMGHYLAGRVSTVVGTHTHVQTSDARIMKNHTAYITDLGMTGPHGDSVIGVRSDIIIKRFTTGIGERFVPGTEGVQLEGVVVEIDSATGAASGIESLRVPWDASKL